MRKPTTIGICALILNFACAAEIQDGIYEILSFDGQGAAVPRNDTTGVVSLGRRIAGPEGTARMRSCSNDNSLYDFYLTGLHVVPGSDQGQQALIVDGICLPAGARGFAADGTFELQCRLRGKDAANTIASHYGITPELRVHPGYRIETHWTSSKEPYLMGDPMPVTLSITNVGDQPVTFFVGGKNRGARDNQYHFLAYAEVDPCKPVPDTGDPLHHGGLGNPKTLGPGETFTATVDLTKWFDFTEPGGYEMTGLFDLDLMENPNPQWQGGHKIIWNDAAVAEFTIRIASKSK